MDKLNTFFSKLNVSNALRVVLLRSASRVRSLLLSLSNSGAASAAGRVDASLVSVPKRLKKWRNGHDIATV